jgi:hypothetical protein
LVGMMYRTGRTRSQLKWLSVLTVIPVLAMIGTSMLTSDDPFGYQYILPAVAFIAGLILGSLPLLDKTEMREHRAWAKKENSELRKTPFRWLRSLLQSSPWSLVVLQLVTLGARRLQAKRWSHLRRRVSKNASDQR